MAILKEPIEAAIASARCSLDLALAELNKVPAFDPNRVGFIAHALGNYLTVSAGTVELLAGALENHQDPEVRGWLVGLEQVMQLMSQAVHQLLTAHSNDRSKLFFDNVDFDLLVRRACSFYRKIAEKKGIGLRVSSPHLSTFAWTDRIATAVILDNLLSNAVKYSEPGRLIHVSIGANPNTVSCCIEDDGPGLSEADQALLFQRGVRLSAVPTGGEHSTGFGLAIAKEMVDRLGGRIWCESTLGKGAKFSFSLPAYDESRHPVQLWLESAHEYPASPHNTEQPQSPNLANEPRVRCSDAQEDGK